MLRGSGPESILTGCLALWNHFWAYLSLLVKRAPLGSKRVAQAVNCPDRYFYHPSAIFLQKSGTSYRLVPVLSDNSCFALPHSASSIPESILTGCLALGKHFWGYLSLLIKRTPLGAKRVAEAGNCPDRSFYHPSAIFLQKSMRSYCFCTTSTR